MSDMMSDITKTPREELECKKKYLYEHSMFWECNNGSKCQILEEEVCDLLNKLYEENEQLRKKCFELEKDYLIETSDISDKIYFDDELKELKKEYGVTDE